MKVRQPYDEPVIVPWLDDKIVNPGQVVDIAPDQLEGFLASTWVPADPEAKKAAAEAAPDSEDQGDAGTAGSSADAGQEG